MARIIELDRVENLSTKLYPFFRYMQILLFQFVAISYILPFLRYIFYPLLYIMRLCFRLGWFSIVLFSLFMIDMIIGSKAIIVNCYELATVIPSFAVQLVMSAIFCALFVYYGLSASIGLIRATAVNRAMASIALDQKLFSRRNMALVADVPETIVYIKRGRRVILLLFFVSAFFFACITHAGMLLLADYRSVLEVAVKSCAEGDGEVLCYTKVVAQELLLNISLATAGFFICSYLAKKCRSIAQRRTIISLSELMISDQRSPVLFLRSFKDDSVDLSSADQNLLGKIYHVGADKLNLDKVILLELSSVGPVIAIGNPSDPRPPFGAARAYLSNSDWQVTVSTLAQQAKIIVLCVDNTEGVLWEIEHLIERDYLDKTLFIIPPRLKFEHKAKLEAFSRLQPKFDLGIESDVTKNTQSIAGVYRRNDGSIVCFKSSKFTSLTFQILLRSFKRDAVGISV